MNAEKANIQTGVDAAGIPEYVFESLARSLLPVIQKYYESEVPSSIMRKFIYNSGRTQSAQGRETCP